MNSPSTSVGSWLHGISRGGGLASLSDQCVVRGNSGEFLCAARCILQTRTRKCWVRDPRGEFGSLQESALALLAGKTPRAAGLALWSPHLTLTLGRYLGSSLFREVIPAPIDPGSVGPPMLSSTTSSRVVCWVRVVDHHHGRGMILLCRVTMRDQAVCVAS